MWSCNHNSGLSVKSFFFQETARSVFSSAENKKPFLYNTYGRNSLHTYHSMQPTLIAALLLLN